MVRCRDLRLVGSIDKTFLPGNLFWATQNSLLIKHKNCFGKVRKGTYYRFFLCLILSSFVHSGLFLTLELDGLKSGKKNSLIANDVSNTLLATIDIQPSVSRHSATARPKSNTLANAALHQPNSKKPSTETNSTFPIMKRYFKANELTLQPKLRGSVAFDNPESTTTPETGTIQLRLLLNAKGSVDKVIVDKASLPETFVESVKYSFSTATFEPGEIDGLPVQSQFFVEIRYESSISK